MSILDNVMNRFGFISQKQFEEGVTEALKRHIVTGKGIHLDAGNRRRATMVDALLCYVCKSGGYVPPLAHSGNCH